MIRKVINSALGLEVIKEVRVVSTDTLCSGNEQIEAREKGVHVLWSLQVYTRDDFYLVICDLVSTNKIDPRLQKYF